nr:ATP-binding protein [Desulfovulcanus ferrireducens]
MPETYPRTGYEHEIINKAKADEILIIQGVRRSGKSTLLINFIRHLIENKVKKENILFVNLEDPGFATDLNLDLLEQIKEAFVYYLAPDEKPYIFLDEIQNIPGFEKWLLKEYELKKSHLFVTGSNAKLLSKEIGSLLSGRYLNIEVMPLSFKEFLVFNNLKINTKLDFINNRLIIEKFFERYMQYGGFPRVVLIPDCELKDEELKVYFDSILLRDIVARYKLDNFKVLEKIAIRMLSSISNIVSLNSLKKSLNLSFNLVNNYVEFLENAYMIFRVPLFAWSLKKQQANPRKIYAIDTGLARRVSFAVGKNEGFLLENIIFLELKRRFSEIYYFKTSRNYEVDFLIKEKEKITHLIQVCLSLQDEKTKKREFRSLVKAKAELKYTDNIRLSVLTKDSSRVEMFEGEKIEVVNVLEWLLWETGE